MAAICASDSSKEKTSAFAAMRAAVTLFGSTMVPRCTAQRSSTLAGARPTSAATPLTTGSCISGGDAWWPFITLPGEPSDVCAVTTMPCAWQKATSGARW